MTANELFDALPSHWEVLPLGDVCSRGGGNVQTGPFGSQLHASDYVPVGIPFVMPQNIGDNRILTDGVARVTPTDAERLSRYSLKQGDILYSRRGDVKRRALVRDQEDGWMCGSGCLRVRFGDGLVDPLYASYYLGHPSVQDWIARHAVGATMPNLNTSILSALPFVVPPMNEQKKIAHILGTLDDKIELNQQMNRTLEGIARALFKSWFIDFDPVRAKLDGRQPYGMDAETAVLFPNSFDDSPLGKIPKEWSVGAADDIITILSGGTPKTSVPVYWNGNIPWFSVKDAPAESDIYVLETEKYITESGVSNSSAQVLPVGTTIVSARGTVGKLALVGCPMAMNQSCYGITGKGNYTSLFIYYFMRSAIISLQQQTHGTVFETITRQTFAAVKTVNPPAELAQEFDKAIRPLLQQIRGNLFEIKTLSSVRDALLPKLLSGEIRVKEAEQALEALIV
jgi:type I restriction enzyme, S subunit